MTAATSTADRLRVGSDDLTLRATSAETGGALFAAEVRMGPGGGPPLMHRHAASEVYHVLEGEFAFYIADVAGTVPRTTGAAGAVVPIPGGRPHTIRNESAADAVAFVVYAPGRRWSASCAPPPPWLRAAAAHGRRARARRAPRDRDHRPVPA